MTRRRFLLVPLYDDIEPDIDWWTHDGENVWICRDGAGYENRAEVLDSGMWMVNNCQYIAVPVKTDSIDAPWGKLRTERFRQMFDDAAVAIVRKEVKRLGL